MAHLTLAIDPGASGGFAWRIDRGAGNQEVHTCPMPETSVEVVAKIKELWPSQAVVEQVGGYVGGGGQPGSRMFTFGRGVGVIVGALEALGIPTRFVIPQTWQKVIGTGSRGGMTKPAWKTHLKRLAQAMYPDQVVTLKTSDALLILDYARTI